MSIEQQNLDEAIVVLITAANRDEAGRLADRLVATRLAACVQILPEIESVYRWQGKIERAIEVLLIAKTMRSQFAELEREVTGAAQLRDARDYCLAGGRRLVGLPGMVAWKCWPPTGDVGLTAFAAILIRCAFQKTQ